MPPILQHVVCPLGSQHFYRFRYPLAAVTGDSQSATQNGAQDRYLGAV